MSHKNYRIEKTCLNCGTEVTKKFCPECGQENIETRENFFHLAGEFISDYFHFDSKFFRSLIPLFTKPGFLTKEYWQGRRVHYIHPLRMFFFTTIIFMISATAFYQNFGEKFKNDWLKSMRLSGPVDASLTQQERERIVKEEEESTARKKKKISKGIDDFFKVIKYATFLLLPVYALVFKVLYRRRRAFYVDHLVYAMHLQSFIYIFLAVVFLLPFILPGSFVFLLKIVFYPLLVYIGISLHFLYKQVWWKTTLKAFLATFSIFLITGMTLLLYAFADAIYFQ